MSIILMVIIIMGVLVSLIIVTKKQEKRLFICRKCEKQFKVKWTNLLFAIHSTDEYRLKCPECGTKDFCKNPEV